MPWSKDKTIPSLKNKSDKVKEVFAEAANSALARGQTDEEAVLAAVMAARNYEKKHQKKEVKPIPLHLQVVLDAAKERLKLATSLQDTEQQGMYQQDLENVSKAVLEPSRTIVDADFDSQERLIIKFDDGSTITTRPIPRTQKVEQQVTVVAPKVVDYLIFDTKANIPLSDRQPGMLTWNFVYSMKQDDYFELMYACTDTSILINAPTSTSFCPSTPSAVIKVTQIDL